MTISETIKWFNSIFDLNRGNEQNAKSDFCCVMTDDVKRYEEEHRVVMLGVTECGDWEIAQKVVERMEREGYQVIRSDIEKEIFPVFVCLYKNTI